MDEDELPRSAVALVRELFDELMDDYLAMRVFLHMLGHDVAAEQIHAEAAEYRHRFESIADNLYSGPNSGR